VAPVLGRRGLIRTAKGDRQGFLAVLSHIRHRLKGFEVWVYVDRAPWHRGEEIHQYFRSHPQLHLMYLPPYQPALNAQERVWRQMRYEVTTNRCFEDLEAIWQEVRFNFRRRSPKKTKRLCNII
jgi:transposase